MLLMLTPAFAADLSVSNVRFDAKKMVVEFDLADAAARPVHAWLIDVGMDDLTSRVTPQNCATAGSHAWHCSASVNIGGPLAGTPEVRVNAVLFDDGTATGDLQGLQDEIDDASLCRRALESWLTDLRNTPPEIAYTDAVMNEREIVDAFAAKETPAQVQAMLRTRLKVARERARLFPEHTPRYAPSQWAPSAVAVVDHAPHFPIVRQEERDGRVRVVMRNDYDREIIAFAFVEHHDDGRLMRSSNGHSIPPGGVQAFDYGPMKNPVELACVLFRDGSADGDNAIVQKMRDGWAGRAAERGRILPLIRTITALPPAERPAATEKLIADLKAHPQEQPDADHSIDYVLGAQAARKAAIRELRHSATAEEAMRNLEN